MYGETLKYQSVIIIDDSQLNHVRVRVRPFRELESKRGEDSDDEGRAVLDLKVRKLDADLLFLEVAVIIR